MRLLTLILLVLTVSCSTQSPKQNSQYEVSEKRWQDLSQQVSRLESRTANLQDYQMKAVQFR